MRTAKHPDRLRAVLDTNVFISMFQFPHGAVAPVWRALLEHRYTLVTSPVILHELADILGRRFGWNAADRTALLKLITRQADLVQPTVVPEVVPNDPDDNHILACAVAGRADLIVSGDRDLLRLVEYAGIPIIRPVDFLRSLGE